MNTINPEMDVYAIPSKEGRLSSLIEKNPLILNFLLAENRFIYFIAIIDPLTNYGFKKQAAKAAKTVKYGSNVDGETVSASHIIFLNLSFQHSRNQHV